MIAINGAHGAEHKPFYGIAYPSKGGGVAGFFPPIGDAVRVRTNCGPGMPVTRCGYITHGPGA